MDLILLAVLLAGVVIVASTIFRSHRRKSDAPGPVTSDEPRTSRQMQALQLVDVKSSPLMNSSELKLFLIIRDVAAACDPAMMVFAQPSMGEYLKTGKGAYTRSEERTAYNAINTKRVDIVVFSAKSEPLLGVEFDGAGHFQGDAVERDAVKRLAFQKAGIPLLSVAPGYVESELRERLAAALASTGPA